MIKPSSYYFEELLFTISVRDNGNGYTARYLNKSATSTSSRFSAMDAAMKKAHPDGRFFYQFKAPEMGKGPGSGWTELYYVVVGRVGPR